MPGWIIVHADRRTPACAAVGGAHVANLGIVVIDPFAPHEMDSAILRHSDTWNGTRPKGIEAVIGSRADRRNRAWNLPDFSDLLLREGLPAICRLENPDSTMRPGRAEAALELQEGDVEVPIG